MEQFHLNGVNNLYQRSCTTLWCLQIVAVIYFTSSLVCEVQGNNNHSRLLTSQVQEQSWRLNWTEQSRNSNSLPKARHRRQSTASISPDTYIYKETWSEHTTKLNRITWTPKSDYTPRVFIYFDTQLQKASGKYHERGGYWILQFTSDVWHYMTKTYGQFGPDPYLYLTVHDMADSNGVYLGYSVDPQNPNKIHFRNILDIWYTNRNDWVNISARTESKDLLVNNLAYFVEKSYKDHFGSPSFNVWKGGSNGHTAWVDIFTYDVYKSLNWQKEAERYENKVNTFEISKNITFWFRDWFLRIYYNQTFNSGGHGVLRNYFQLIYDYVPKNTEKVYTYNFTLGDFVHFWSAAANVSLKPLAEKIFGWSEDLEQKFRTARTIFSDVSRFYAYEAITEQPTTPPITTTTPIVTTYGHVNNFDTTISAVTSKNNSDSGSTEKTDSSDSESANKNTNSASHNRKSQVILVASVAGSIILLLVIVLITTYICQKKRIIYLEADIRMLTSDELNDFFEGNKDTSIGSDEAQALIQSMPFITAFEIPKDQMVLDYTKILGSGQFGSVIQGQIRSSENDEMISVAMKTVKPNVDVDSFKAFLSEVKIMAYLGKHENIVELLGTCTAHIQNREIYIALEFCHFGSLENYLKKNRDKFEITGNRKCSSGSAPGLSSPADNNDANITASAVASLNGNKIDTLDLLKWSREVSNAMIYLTEKKVIHGDLAARNVLLTEHRVAKISDFGLSRQFLNYANYMKTSKVPVPWRWLAVESLKEMKFSTASDVWAFGVTLWEIFSLSEIPYGAWTYDLFFADRLIAGDRLGVPKHGNEQIYELLKNCWKVDPTERPSFQTIYNILNELISSNLAIP